ncbi:MAG: hypothetical protein IPM85_00075 [Chitinophagaceae bacterium]|nr:hypothetical protein [Chitinophagaceae bacterium]
MLKQSELFNRSILTAISAHIAVLDEDGTIVTVNKAWNDFSLANGETNLQRTCVGSNYFW